MHSIAYPKVSEKDNPSPVQDYLILKEKHLRDAQLFEDPLFPTEQSSIDRRSTEDATIQWLRPSDICRSPQFFVDGASRFDVHQGSLNDCWLVTAAANLTNHDKLFRRTIPSDNSFASDDYAGLFHFRFWQYGQWMDVVIDDRLPTRNSKLLYMRSSQRNEFWSALLEKAYAKLHGSYHALNLGTAREAMQDFTGGITEFYNLKDTGLQPNELFEIIRTGWKLGSLFACNMSCGIHQAIEYTSEGLLRGHSYSITKVYELQDDAENVQLIRLRNPWGDGTEWNGAWSDQSQEWRQLNAEQRRHVGLTIDIDGEFWMSFPDFLVYFDRLEICHLSPDLPSLQPRHYWQVSTVDGAWVKDSTAGGYIGYLDTFATNPQYTIRIEDGRTQVLISLMQKYRRMDELPSLTIGLIVYRVTENDLKQKPMPKEFFDRSDDAIVGSTVFINSREITCRLELDVGIYLIIPSTHTPHQDGEFLLRVFSELQNYVEENDCTPSFEAASLQVMEVDSIFTTSKWEHIVRTYYELVDQRSQQLDYRGLALILERYFLRQNVAIEVEIPGFWQMIKAFLRSFCSCCLLPVKFTAVKQPPVIDRKITEQIAQEIILRIDYRRKSGLDYEQFRLAIRDIHYWCTMFSTFDLDQNGTLDRKELKQALKSIGYRVNNRIINRLLLQIEERTDGRILLVDYLLCAVEVRRTIVVESQQPTADYTLKTP